MTRLFKRSAIFLLLSFLFFLNCGSPNREQSSSRSAPQIPKNALELVFTYGSEKEKWIKDVTDEFNRQERKLSNGKSIFVNAIPMGSGECIDEILSGRRKAHLTSPASGAFVKLGNAQSRAATGKDLIGTTDNLVLSQL